MGIERDSVRQNNYRFYDKKSYKILGINIVI
ncbi:Uncharacterised protein [Chryseobacterium nakagawai]|nr:Uncharacterised protein [Chryseobacterium nakagawai]